MNRMALWRLCISLFAIGLTACAQEPRPPEPQVLSSGWKLQDQARVTAPADMISRTGFDDSTWRAAVVPGTVLTSLVADGVYPEPLYGENNRPDKIPDSLCQTSYWYRTEFVAPAAKKDARVWLNFEGINYIAQVWVNGNRAGQIRGAFSRGRFDVTSFVIAGEKSAVAVKIMPPPDPGVPEEQTVAAGVGKNGGILAKDGPTFLATIGWDWIPGIRDRNIGIWQNVWLENSGPVILHNPFVTSVLPLPRTDSADLTISMRVENVTDGPQNGLLKGAISHALNSEASFTDPSPDWQRQSEPKISDLKFERKIELEPHESRIVQFTVADTPGLHLIRPRLWWPNGYGPAELYSLHLQFNANGRVSCARDTSFGIRQITYSVPGSENLTICVNGVPIICKGGDWGMDEAMKRIPRDRLEARIRMHRLANFNMIRNWVGQSTSEDFYDLCDRYGILVWDEFFQPNPSDGPNPADLDLYLANVREKVLRFRGHPCIALWCARNEGNPPKEIDAGIAAVMKELDPTRLYQRNSSDGKGVRSGGPYSWRQPRQFYVFPETEAFKTEIGSVSIPTLESVQAMMPRKDWWPPLNDDWAEHDLARGAQRGDLYPQAIATRYGPCTSLTDFVREAQLANYEAFRAMFEGRFVKLFKPVTGVITWMSNPAQPSFVWQIYSHDLDANASLFGAKKACEPLHVMMNQANDHVVLINALPRERKGLWVWLRVANLDGSIASEETPVVDAPPLSATDLGPIDFPGAISPVHFVKLVLLEPRGSVLSENFYWRTKKMLPPATIPSPTTRRFRDRPIDREDFTDLQKLPTVPVDVGIMWRYRNGRGFIEATIANRGSAVALMTHVQARNAATGERILPAYYSDNYVSLLPGETRTIRIEADYPTLKGARVAVTVDGWNVRTGTIEYLPSL